MIIGDGLLGKEFKKNKEKYKNTCIFASGVSYANCSNRDEFKRESDLLSEQNKNMKIVYFSSFHVLKETDSYKEYSEHKKKMESYIISNFGDFLIIRLPNVIGLGGNNHTLFRLLYNNLLNQETMNVYTNAYRYLIDVSDVEYFTYNLLLRNHNYCNMFFDSPIKITKIIDKFEKILCKNYIRNDISQGEGKFFFDNSIFKQMLIELEFKYDEDLYLENLITKYFT